MSVPIASKNVCSPDLPRTIRSILAETSVPCNVCVSGWARSVRSSKHVSFIALGDGSSLATLQVVLGDAIADREALIATLSTGASVQVEGTLVASPKAGQAHELQATAVKLLGAADPVDYPLQKKGHSLEFLRSVAHLRARSNTFGAVFRIRATLAQATHDFFRAQTFQYVHTPLITASDCEGAGEMFEVTAPGHTGPFFGRQAFLTVSGQLNGEALAYGLGRIYTFGPTFRAENSNTARHLAEFWMIEPEMAFFDLSHTMALAEAYLKACVSAVRAQHSDELAFLAKHYDATLETTLATLCDAPFARATYTEAIAILEAAPNTFEFPVAWGLDLKAEHERYLAEEHFKRPVIVTDYPRGLKSFYMYQNEDGKTVRAMDLLVGRIGELIGGSQREHRLDKLAARLDESGIDKAPYAWYFDLHRYGGVTHAGFGLGFERLVMLCTGMSNIRDVIPFPRAVGLAPF